jgi:hypothetical protein
VAVHDLSPLVVALGLKPVNLRQLPHASASHNPRRRAIRDFGDSSDRAHGGGGSSQGSGVTAAEAGGSSPHLLASPRSPQARRLPLQPKAEAHAAAKAAALRERGAAAALARAAERRLEQRGVAASVPMLQDPSNRPQLVTKP